MRRFLLILTMTMASIVCYAQGYKAYITVTYSAISQSAVIVYGEQTTAPKTKFKTFVSLLNWLSKKGWSPEPILAEKNGNNTTVFMSRDKTTDAELKTMFQ